MLRSIVLLAILLPLYAQFPEIVTTGDGGQTYFNTNATLRHAPPPPGAFPEYRAYRVVSSGLELFAERGPLARTGSAGSGDGVTSLQVSSDGQSVAYTLINICEAGAGAENCTSHRSEIRGRYAQILGQGTVWMSRNGEWALLVAPPPAPADASTLIHLPSGRRREVPLPATRENPLTSNGAVVVRGPVPGILKDDHFQPLHPPNSAFSLLRISDDGRMLFMSVPRPNLAIALVARDLETQTDRELITGASLQFPELLDITDDGRLALVRIIDTTQPAGQSAGRAWIIDTESPNPVELTSTPNELVASGAISGFGNAALVFTNSGRLLRFELDRTGGPMIGAQELLAPSPYISSRSFHFSPGEPISFGIVAPGVSDWANRVRIQGAALPVLSSNVAGPTVQVPWELQPGIAEITLDLPAEGPFVSKQSAIITAAHPLFVRDDAGSNSLFPGIKIVKGDFSGYLTENPQPGDIVHLYMTGLGPVQGAVQTGEPAPLDDIRPITGSFTCQFLPAANAETLFAGLAPGTVGYYQVTLRMPANIQTVPVTGLDCRLETGGSSHRLRYTAPPQSIRRGE